MYWLIENREQLKVLINSGYKKAFIEVIPYNDTIHPVLNRVSLVYIRPLEASKGFMVCIAHSESLNALNTGVDKLLEKFETLYFNFHIKKKLSTTDLAKQSGIERTHLYRKLKSLGIKSK